MDSCVSNFLDKNDDVKLSNVTCSTHLKTEREIESLMKKTETVSDNVNTFIKQDQFVDESVHVRQEICTCVDGSVNFRQETFANESVNIKQETKKEEIFHENVASPEDEVDVNYSRNYTSLLQKVKEEESFSKGLDMKHDSGNMAIKLL